MHQGDKRMLNIISELLKRVWNVTDLKHNTEVKVLTHSKSGFSHADWNPGVVWASLSGDCHMSNGLMVNYPASVWPGSVRCGAGGAVFLHPVCSNLSRAAKTDEQRRMDRAANDTPLLAWNISNNKYRRQPYIKLQPFAYIWRDKHTSCVPIGWIYHSEGESVVFVCDELANQHLIVGSCLLANIFVANGANFLVALAPAVT